MREETLTGLSSMPRSRLEEIARGALAALSAIQPTIEEETGLHVTVEAQRRALAELNEALAHRALQPDSGNEDYYREALEQLAAVLVVSEDDDRDTVCKTIALARGVIASVLPARAVEAEPEGESDEDL